MTAESAPPLPPPTEPVPPTTDLVRTRARIIGLDGARGLSCLGVAVMHVTAHFSPHTAATWKTNIVGLSLIFFYVLSGFLLFLPYVRKLTETASDGAHARAPRTSPSIASRESCRVIWRSS